MKSLIVAALLLMLAACSGSGAKMDAFKPYSAATLTPGVGLGDLLLQATTLQSFVERFGRDRYSVIATDDIGIELTFGEGSIAFLFLARDECARDLLAKASQVAREFAEMDSFFAENPRCAAMPLHSIGLRAAASREDNFYSGATDQGVVLGSPVAQVLAAHGAGDDLRGLLVAGESPDDASLDVLSYATGLVLYVGSAPEGDPNAGKLVVRRMGIIPRQGG